jgi:hypothetical protein
MWDKDRGERTDEQGTQERRKWGAFTEASLLLAVKVKYYKDKKFVLLEKK